MPWASRIHRIVRGGVFSANGRRFRTRAVITQHVIEVKTPLLEPIVVAPGTGLGLDYATDLWQRIYCDYVGDRQYLRTIHFGGGLYSAPSPGGGEPPGADDTWTLIPETDLGPRSANVAHYLQVVPDWLAGHTFVDLSTTVWQDPHKFREPFVVVHELWGNHFRWFRLQHPSPVAGSREDTAIPSVRDGTHRLTSRKRG
jgi:hypothetical protein